MIKNIFYSIFRGLVIMITVVLGALALPVSIGMLIVGIGNYWIWIIILIFFTLIIAYALGNE